MAYRYINFFNIFYKNNYKKMTELTGILLFGLLIYGLVTGFDDGNGYDKFN